VHPLARIGAYSIIDAGAEIGADCVIETNVRIYGFTQMGEGNRICHGATIGSQPQDMSYSTSNAKPLTIGNNNVFRENTDISHGIKEEHGTVIGDNNYFMIAAHIGHDCILEDNNIFAPNAILGGHVELGHDVYMSGHTAVHQFCKIGSLAMVSGLSAVVQDVPPFVMVDGHRAEVVGLNVVGLRRAGFSSEERKAIKQAYKILYKSGLRQNQAVEKLKASYSTKPVQEIIDFIGTSTRGLVSHR